MNLWETVKHNKYTIVRNDFKLKLLLSTHSNPLEKSLLKIRNNFVFFTIFLASSKFLTQLQFLILPLFNWEERG
jgi:hypothetical protein